MSITYTPATNFGAKDSLPTNDPDKVIKGSEFTTEFTAIQTAFGLAAPAASPTFTGTVTIASVDINGGNIDGTTIGGTTPAAGTFSSLTATTADINGGTIDGVTIGGSSAGAITGTTGQFNTSLNVDGAVTADGLNLDASVNSAITFENQAGTTADGSISTFDDASGTLLAIGSNFYISNAGSETRFNTGEEASGLVLNRTGTITARTSDGTNNTLARFNIANNGDISFYEDTGTTPKFFWDASAESLGIGLSSPAKPLHVSAADATVRIENTNSASYATLSLMDDTAEQAYVWKNGSAQSLYGGARSLQLWNNSNAAITFGTNNTERMRIDSSGNLLVGTTGTSWTNTPGFYVFNQSAVNATRDGNEAVNLNRLTSDGDIAIFRKDGTTVGSIGVANGDNLYIAADDTTDVGLKFDGDANAIYGCDASGGIRDAAITLGDPAVRFKDLYLSGGVYLGGTGSANLLDDYEEGTWTPSITFGGNAVGVTYSPSFNRGWYTRVGRVVTLKMALEVTNKGSSTGHLEIAVPFASTLTNASHAQKVQHNKINAISLAAYGTAGTSTFGIYKAVASTTSSQEQITDADCGTSFSILASITYMI